MSDAETNYVPEDAKKKPLFEIFRAAVWSQLIGDKELKEALDAGKKAGVTDQDLEAISQWDAKKLKDYFGPAAINRDLVNAMKASDVLVSGMGSAFGYGSVAPYKELGFYK